MMIKWERRGSLNTTKEKEKRRKKRRREKRRGMCGREGTDKEDTERITM